MKKFKTLLLLGLLLAISACSAPAATATQPAEIPPTPFPDTPAPVEINAPIVESPSLVDIHFLNELDGWGVTETQIVRTNDGGITWYNVTPPDVTETGFNINTFYLDNQHVWIQSPDFENYPNGGTLYRTSDGGITWTSATVLFSRGNLSFLDANNGWMLADLGVGAGSNAVAIFQTTDSGATWNQTYINDPNSSDARDSLPLGGLKSGLAPLNMKTAWVSGTIYSPGTIYLFRTDDGGANWVSVTIGPLPAGVENADLSIKNFGFVTSHDVFMTLRVASDESKMAVYVSNDAGNTWALTSALIPNGGSADFLSAEEMVIYNGEQFYVTRDGALTWSTVTPDVVFGDTFALMDFVNTATGWIITVDLENHRSLYRTNDGGATWSPIIP